MHKEAASMVHVGAGEDMADWVSNGDEENDPSTIMSPADGGEERNAAASCDPAVTPGEATRRGKAEVATSPWSSPTRSEAFWP